MKPFLTLLLLVPTALSGQAAQSPQDSRHAIASQLVESATRELQRVKELVALGVEARNRVVQAEKDLADAEDGAVIESILYSQPPAVNDALEESMVAAARRRVDRATERVEQTRKLIANGLDAPSAIAPVEEELDNRKMDLHWSQAHVQFRTEAAALAKAGVSIADALEATRTEYQDPSLNVMEHYEGASAFDEARDLKPLARAFATQFERPLPISADGQTELHRMLGFDHHGRVDVALNPSDPDGVWLRGYLQLHKIPYYAFTRAVAGKATAAHIHIGAGSTRLPALD